MPKNKSTGNAPVHTPTGADAPNGSDAQGADTILDRLRRQAAFATILFDYALPFVASKLEGVAMPLLESLVSWPTTKAVSAADVRFDQIIPPTEVLRGNVNLETLAARKAAGETNVVEATTTDGEVVRTRTINPDGKYIAVQSPGMPDAYAVLVSGVRLILLAIAGGTANGTFQDYAKSVGFEPGQRLDAFGNPVTNKKGNVIKASWRYAEPTPTLMDQLAAIVDEHKLTIPPPLDYRSFGIEAVARETKGVLKCAADGPCGKDAQDRDIKISFQISPAQHALFAEEPLCATHNVSLTWTPPDAGEAEADAEMPEAKTA